VVDLTMWNDTDIPLAFLIIFRSHGTWLHGDERGAVSRFRNEYKSHKLPLEKHWVEINKKRLRGEPVALDADQRDGVEAAARETCEFRKWALHAINVRTNHVHLVVSTGGTRPELALNAFQANATRMMKKAGCWDRRSSPWVDKGSTRYLWNERVLSVQSITFVMGKAMTYQTLRIER